MILKTYTKLAICAGILILSTRCKEREPAKTGMEGKSLPSFSLLLPDSTTWLKTKDVKPGKPLVFFLFGPNCPFSKAQMKEIIENIKDLKDVQFYVLTPYPFDQLKGFYMNYELNKYANIHVGQDKTNFFGQYLNVQGVPFIAIYNTEKQLKRAYLGKVDINVLKEIVNN